MRGKRKVRIGGGNGSYLGVHRELSFKTSYRGLILTDTMSSFLAVLEMVTLSRSIKRI